jgi:hypothetical protein
MRIPDENNEKQKLRRCRPVLFGMKEHPDGVFFNYKLEIKNLKT